MGYSDIYSVHIYVCSQKAFKLAPVSPVYSQINYRKWKTILSFCQSTFYNLFYIKSGQDIIQSIPEKISNFLNNSPYFLSYSQLISLNMVDGLLEESAF